MFRWFANYFQKKELEDYRRGFGWAMASYYVDEMPVVAIDSRVERSVHAKSFNKFDEGVMDAVNTLLKLHPKKANPEATLFPKGGKQRRPRSRDDR